MPIAGVFEVGARILRRHAPTLLAIAVLIQLAGAILDAVAQQRLVDSVSPLFVGFDTDTPSILMPTGRQSDVILGSAALVGGSMLVSLILGAVATVGYTQVVSDDYQGRTVSLAAALAAALRRAVPAIVAAFLAAVAALGAALITAALAWAAVTVAPSGDGSGGPGVFLALVIGVAGTVATLTLFVRLSLAAIVVAGEDAGPVTALRRSWHLTGANTWRVFAVLALVALAVSILASLLVQLLGVAVSDTVGVQLGMVATSEALIAAVVSVLFAPVAVVIQAVLYFDLRVRRDAWDVPSMPVDVAGSDADAGR